MKKTIYIHVGFGKTGTSAIQKVFFQNREQLKSIGCLYPITGEIFTAHYNLSVLGEEEMDTKTINLYEKLLVEIKNSNCNIIVLSSEQFIFLKELYVKQISEFLKDFDVKIIFYIREQIKLIESTYLQWLKAGSKPFYKNIYEFYSQHKDSFNFN